MCVHPFMAMAAKGVPQLIFTLLLVSLLIPSSLSSHKGTISTYWGQNGNEGSLTYACDSGNYGIVNIAFLSTFGSGRTPVLDLASHCDPTASTCTALSSEIKHCQAKEINVFLSIGGGNCNCSLSSPEDAGSVAKYLWYNFLGGNTGAGPLGDAVLDGIDFAIDDNRHAGKLYWDDLARNLSALNNGKKFYLAAAPQCLFPDELLSAALSTGLFNYVQVQFYNNPPCQYADNSADNLKYYWNQYWTTIPAEQLLLGLPAAPNASNGGYIEPDTLAHDVLPAINGSSKYGGVMLWSRFYDTWYSSAIKPFV